MAERPVFVPNALGSRFVDEVSVTFSWHAGMSASQKRKNVHELHSQAARIGLAPLLETSSKSDSEGGRRLSAFYLPLEFAGVRTTVESVFQGSKIFEHGGPYFELYNLDSRSAKLDPRLSNSGQLVGFFFDNKRYPLSPPTVFYDWIYITALLPYRDWLRRLDQFVGFTDIEFNPARSINCQARSCALFVSLERRALLDSAVVSFDNFLDMQRSQAM